MHKESCIYIVVKYRVRGSFCGMPLSISGKNIVSENLYLYVDESLLYSRLSMKF